MAISLNPYIFFRGDCREAMEFYKGVFGGELTMQTYDEAPNMPGMEEMKGKIMHASLNGGDAVIMASDTKEASAKSAKVELSLGGDDEAHLTDIFNALGDGGNITSPLKKEFWGDTFGTLTDKFGVNWMVNISAKKE